MAQGITGSGTTNKVAKFTGTTSVGNSSLTDNGNNVSTTEQFDSTLPNDLTSNSAVHASIVESSGNNAFGVDAQCTANSGSSGVGCEAVHALGQLGNSIGAAFGVWSQAFDNGYTTGAVGEEINNDSFATSRSIGKDRGQNIKDLVGPGTTAGSSGEPASDWGLLIQGYGYGLVLAPSAVTAAESGGYEGGAFHDIWIRNQAGVCIDGGSCTTGTNKNTTVLSFEGPQPDAFNYGLDFRNASFKNPGGCCAIVTSSSALSQMGKVGNASGSNNLAGTCAFSGAASCSKTFTNSYAAAPVCIVTLVSNSAPGTGFAMAVNATTTGLTIYSNTALNNNVNYDCIANPD